MQKGTHVGWFKGSFKKSTPSLFVACCCIRLCQLLGEPVLDVPRGEEISAALQQERWQMTTRT